MDFYKKKKAFRHMRLLHEGNIHPNIDTFSAQFDEFPSAYELQLTTYHVFRSNANSTDPAF